MDIPKIEIPNISVDEMLKTYMKVQSFQQKERERLAKHFLKKRMEKLGFKSIEEYNEHVSKQKHKGRPRKYPQNYQPA